MILLSTNSKLEKSPNNDYLIQGLSLPPHKISGVNLCEFAGVCSSVCLGWFSGRLVTSTVRNAMKKRAELWINDSAEFYRRLRIELVAHERKAHKMGAIALTRLNVASDVDWSNFVEEQNQFVANSARFSSNRFYDYTKVVSRIRRQISGNWPSNYNLTYSVSERSNTNTIKSILNSGCNVSVVTDTLYQPQQHKIGSLPKWWYFGNTEYKMVDGDKHDRRIPECDGRGVVIGLRFKGSRKRMPHAIKTGFVFTSIRKRFTK